MTSPVDLLNTLATPDDATPPDVADFFRRAATFEVLDDASAIVGAMVDLKRVVERYDSIVASSILDAARAHPLTFASSFGEGVVASIFGPVRDLIRIALAAVGWLASVSDCFVFEAAIELDSLTWHLLDQSWSHDASEYCKSLEGLTSLLNDVRAWAQRATALMEYVAQHPIDSVLQCLNTVAVALTVIATELEKDTRISAWLRENTSDPSKAGMLMGVCVGTIALPIGGEAAATIDGIKAVQMAAAAAEAAEAVESATAATADAVKAANAALEAEPALGVLMVRLRQVMLESRAGVRLTAVVDNNRLQAFRDVSAFAAQVGADIPSLQKAVVAAYHALYGRIGSFKSLETVCTRFNTHSLLIFMLDLQESTATAETLDAVALVKANRRLKAQVFERAHLIDKRFLRSFPQFTPAFDFLGWKTIDDMDAAIVQARDHTGSLPRYFKRLGEPLPADPDELGSITKAMNAAIVSRAPAAGNTSVKLVVTPDISASTLFEVHLEVWQTRFQRMAELGVRARLEALIAQLKSAGY